MTFDQFKQLLLSIDPAIKKTFWAGTGDAYTVYKENSTSFDLASDRPARAVKTYTVSRYAKTDKDQLAANIRDMLANQDEVWLTSETTDYESDTKYHVWHWVVDVLIGG